MCSNVCLDYVWLWTYICPVSDCTHTKCFLSWVQVVPGRLGSTDTQLNDFLLPIYSSKSTPLSCFGWMMNENIGY